MLDVVDTMAGLRRPAFRFVWPSELDLMARIAGMESRRHVSV
ncbi:MAG: hypothetical protein AAF081_14215 [Actinomycetota bacterium]